MKKVSDGGDGGVWVTAIIGLLKKCYNAWATITTAAKANEDSERIDWPAPSVIGAATPQMFFEALRPGDLESGFANRLLILPFEGHRKPPRQSPHRDLKILAPELIAGLLALPRQTAGFGQIMGATLSADGSSCPRPKIEDVPWGEGAEDAYGAFIDEMDALEDGERQRHELSMRAGENAVRIATVVAVARGAPTVDREDIAWAIAVARESLEAAVGGVAKYMRDHVELPQLCEKVLEWITAEGGFVSNRDLARWFRPYIRRGFELAAVISMLKAEGRIAIDTRAGPKGPAAAGWRLVAEEES